MIAKARVRPRAEDGHQVLMVRWNMVIIVMAILPLVFVWVEGASRCRIKLPSLQHALLMPPCRSIRRNAQGNLMISQEVASLGGRGN